MFNSQKINNDPNPYTLVNLDGNIIGRVTSKQPNGHVSCRFEPREEYDNNPSPLLLEIRELLDIPDRMKTYEVNLNALNSPRYEVLQPKDVVDHARKVLTKLVNVYGNKEEQQ